MDRLPKDVLKQLRKSFFVPRTNIAVYRLLDILATPDGDVSKIANKLREVDERELRKAFHNCAELLRGLETYYGSPGPKPEKAKLGKWQRPSARLKEVKRLRIFIDASSLGNPGPASVGVVFCDPEGNILYEFGEYIGETTANFAEATGLKRALEEALKLGKRLVQVHSDSELLVRQVKGEYKIKHPQLQVLHQEIKRIIKRFEEFSIGFVARGQNKRADKLAELALKDYEGKK